MSITAALPTRSGTIIDRFVSRTVASNIALVLGGTLVVSLLAQVTIPIGPIPITGQTLGVMLVAASLGAVRGAASMVVYMLVGLAGAPVFAGFTGGPLSVLKPSFGFVIGFIAAAFVVGWLAERNWDRNFFTSLAMFLGGSVIPFVFGLPYMALILSTVSGVEVSLELVLAAGVIPFIIPGVIKWLLSAALLPIAHKAVDAADRKAK